MKRSRRLIDESGRRGEISHYDGRKVEEEERYLTDNEIEVGSEELM